MKEDLQFLVGEEVFVKLSDDSYFTATVTDFIYPFMVFDKDNLVRYTTIFNIRVLK